MTSAKDVFLSKKQLRNWWARVVDDPQFVEVLLHARSAFIEGGVTQDQLAGAGHYERILTSLHDAVPSELPMPSPGLHHQVDQVPEMPEEPPFVPKPDPKPVKSKKK